MSVYSVVLLKLYLNIFFEEICDKKKFLSAWFGFIIWQFLINSDRYPIPGGINLIITFIVTLTTCILAYQGDVGKKTIFSVAYLAVWMVLESLGWSLLLSVYQTEPSMTAVSLLSKTIFLIIIMVISYCFKRFDNDKENIHIEKGLLGVPIFSIILCYTLYEMGQEADPQKNKVQIMVITGTVVLTLVNLSLYSLFIKLAEIKQMKANSQVYMEQMELYRQQREDDEMIIREVRQERHNIKHKFIYLQEIAVQEGNKRIEQAIEKITNETLTIADRTVQTGILSVDSIINSKKREAEAKGICFNLRLEISSEMQISDIDLCVLLGNVLDNAIEAVDKLNCNEKIIFIELIYKKGILFIKTRNQYEGSIEWLETGKRIKSKKPESVHGYGLQSVSKIVSRYHGTLSIDVMDHEFCLDILMYG